MWDWAPFHFSDYIGFIALSFVVYYWAYHKLTQGGWHHFVWLILIAFLSYFSGNMSLIYGALIAISIATATFFLLTLRQCVFSLLLDVWRWL